MADSGPRMRPAHPEGLTFAAYTPSGRRLVTAGSNDQVRVFQHGSDGEPTNIGDCSDSNTALVVANDFFIIGSEDGTVSKYSLESNSLDQLLTRSSLPIRDLAISPDGQWVAVASDEITVKLVNIRDMTNVRYCRAHPKPAKHVSFDFAGSILTVSCSDGILYSYDISSTSAEEPEVLRKVDGVIQALDTEDIKSSRAVWHPDGRAFVCATAAREIQTVSKRDWEPQRAFKSGHSAPITALAWSPNGALLVTAAQDRRITIWSTKTQSVLHTHNLQSSAAVLSLTWHPTDNTLSYTTSDGELFIHASFVPAPHASLLELDLQPAPFIHDPLREISGNAGGRIVPREKHTLMRHDSGRGSSPVDSLDEMLDVANDDDDGFVEDDDGAGYAAPPNVNGKRSAHHLAASDGVRPLKRRAHAASWEPSVHASFQPGATPWRGNRRYLCLNLIGAIWTVDQDSHHSVTVEFYDRDTQRDFHFTDVHRFDNAVLGDRGCLFAYSGEGADEEEGLTGKAASLYYRPHAYWTSERADWRAELPAGERVSAIALSERYVVVCCDSGYVRLYTLFGVPVRIWRAKSAPLVSAAAWRDYVMVLSNGGVGSDGACRLMYSIENIKRDEVIQSEDGVAVPMDGGVAGLFWSDEGDPCIYDTTGVLLTLQHWRTPGQARWVPLLDTKLLPRLASGRKDESYWPVGVAGERFYCIILKGGDRYPYFPRPLLNDFGFSLPVADPAPEPAGGADEDFGAATRRLEEHFVRASVLHAIAEDAVLHTSAGHEQRQGLARRELEADKILLQLLAQCCREGEEGGMKALEVVGLLRDKSGRMLDAAGKIAARFERGVLREKIEELAERRLVGLDEDGE